MEKGRNGIFVEFQNQSMFGIEGVHYTDNGEHTFVLDKNIENWEQIFFYNTVSFDPKEVVVGDRAFMGECGLTSLSNFAQYALLDNRFLIPAEYSTLWDTSNNLWKEFSTQFILGQKSESDWEGFVKDWYDYGGKDITAYANEILK